MKWFPGKFISALLTLIISVPMMFVAGTSQLENSLAAQKARMDGLRQAYSAGTYTRCNESEVTGFDVEAAVNRGVRFNEVSFIGTHNSYQLAASKEYSDIYRSLSTLTFGLVFADRGEFNSETLTDQFNMGIRSIELDIETMVKGSDVSFVCTHEPAMNMNSSCADFALALEEIKLWSDNNPNHLPITVIIEPKKAFATVDNLRYFNLKYAQKFDELLRNSLGDTLLTPADAMGNFASFGEMRAANEWPLLKDTLGKVVVMLHETNVTNAYIKSDSSIKTQAMFPMLRYSDRDKSYASFLIINSPDEALKYSNEVVCEKKLIVRTRADSYGSIAEQDRKDALESGAQIVSTDYPVRKDNATGGNLFSFENGATVALSVN